MRTIPRPIDAPDRDTLSATEVAVYLGYRDGKSVESLVEKGKFPEPIEDEGGRKWFWEDVVWYLMNKRIKPRLRKAPDETPAKDAKKGRTNPGTGGIVGDSAGSGELDG